MLISMTGYSRKVVSHSMGSFVIELQSINRKYLEINIYLARGLYAFEIEMRKRLGHHLKRGQVTLRISSGDTGAKEGSTLPTLDVLKTLKSHYDTLKDDLGYREEIPLTYLLNKAEELTSRAEFDESFKAILFEGIEQAILQLNEMRRSEGKELEKDILKQLSEAQEAVQAVEKQASGYAERIREKLLEKYRAFVGEMADPERVIKEAFLLAEKSDINEEIARLHSHFQQFRHMIDSQESGIGKNLEFLIQEMHRETGTILAKSSEIEIKTLVLNAKAAIEKMREQVQNIE